MYIILCFSESAVFPNDSLRIAGNRSKTDGLPSKAILLVASDGLQHPVLQEVLQNVSVLWSAD